jgi:hypothetical protein
MSTIPIEGGELSDETYSPGKMAQARSEADVRRSRVLTNALGAGIVLVCLALPLALAAITESIETSSRNAYLADAPVHLVAGRGAPGDITDRHIYFISGCVSNPGDCGSAGPGNWTEYHVFLRELYLAAPQKPGAYIFFGYDTWGEDHLHFRNARTSTEGAFALKEALSRNDLPGDIHLAGSSVGGSAIITYMSQAMRGEAPWDPRIRDVLTIDAPLGFQPPFALSDLPLGFPAGGMKSDVEPGLAEWARLMDVRVLTLDTPYDILSHEQLPGIAHDPNAFYPGTDTPSKPFIDENCRSGICQLFSFIEIASRRIGWHTYTGDHLSVPARRFIEENWR